LTDSPRAARAFVLNAGGEGRAARAYGNDATKKPKAIKEQREKNTILTNFPVIESAVTKI